MHIREQARARARARRALRQPGACQPGGALTRGAPGSVVANFSPLPEDTTELKDGDLVKMCAPAPRLRMQSCFAPPYAEEAAPNGALYVRPTRAS